MPSTPRSCVSPTPPTPPALGDDLLRLFAAVCASPGGYALPSPAGAGVWAVAARSAALAAPIKLLYAKYLGALDSWIQRLPEAQPPQSEEKQGQEQGQGHELLICDANGVEKEEPSMDCSERDQQHAVLKRKRDDMAGMLDWVRGLAESASEEGTAGWRTDTSPWWCWLCGRRWPGGGLAAQA